MKCLICICFSEVRFIDEIELDNLNNCLLKTPVKFRLLRTVPTNSKVFLPRFMIMREM